MPVALPVLALLTALEAVPLDAVLVVVTEALEPSVAVLVATLLAPPALLALLVSAVLFIVESAIG